MKQNLVQKILDNTEEILRNTDNIYLAQELEIFLDDFSEFEENTECDDLLEVMKIITEDGYDISDFGLWEIPHPSVYVFYNELLNQMFDVCLNNLGDVKQKTYIGYINEHFDECYAPNIEFAIQNFNQKFLE